MHLKPDGQKKRRNSEIDAIFRMQLNILESIKDNYSKGQIQTVIADISTFVKKLDLNEDVSFIALSTNTLPSAIHLDIAAQNEV